MARKWVPPVQTWLEKADAIAGTLRDTPASLRAWKAVLHESTAARRRSDIEMEQECLKEYLTDIMAIERAPKTAQKGVDAALAALADAKAVLTQAKRAKAKAKGLRGLLKAAQVELAAVAALAAELPEKTRSTRKRTTVTTIEEQAP
jgi:hypothetical protein